MVARAFDDLRNGRKWTHFRVNGDEGDVPDLKSNMAALEFFHLIYGASFK